MLLSLLMLLPLSSLLLLLLLLLLLPLTAAAADPCSEQRWRNHEATWPHATGHAKTCNYMLLMCSRVRLLQLQATYEFIA